MKMGGPVCTMECRNCWPVLCNELPASVQAVARFCIFRETLKSTERFHFQKHNFHPAETILSGLKVKMHFQTTAQTHFSLQDS